MTLHDQLAHIHPALPALTLALVVGGIVWSWRRLHPASFNSIPKKYQPIPAMVIAAILATITNGENPVYAAIDTVVAALLAIGGHHTVEKRLLKKGEVADE